MRILLLTTFESPLWTYSFISAVSMCQVWTWMIWMLKWSFNKSYKSPINSDLTSSSHIWKSLQSRSVLLILTEDNLVRKPLDYVASFFPFFLFPFTYPHPYHTFRVVSFKDNSLFYIYILKASQDIQYQKQLTKAELICTCPKHAYLHINTITLK